MSHQYVYSNIPANQNYIQDLRLIQYNVIVNPLNPSHYRNKSYNIQNLNQVYAKQMAYNQQIDKNQNMNPRQAFPFQQQNNFGQVQLNQNISQKYYPKNNFHTLQGLQQIKPKIVSQHNQNIHNLILPKPQIQTQQIPQANTKQQIQHQPQFPKNYQPKANPLVQPNYQNQKIQQKAAIEYQNYLHRYPLQNQNKKIDIKYNKKDEHFVNKPIFPNGKPPSNNSKAKLSKGQQKQLNRIEILDKEIKMDGIKNNQELPKNQGGFINKTKMNNKKISIEEKKEKEINVNQIEPSYLESKISNKSIDVKESPIEGKTPEPTFQELMGEDNQNIIIKKSISPSGISDYVANLSHLPTINSILRGNSELLPQ